jgi:hypothetical protein
MDPTALENLTYLSGSLPLTLPLGRFLPPLPSGMVSGRLSEQLKQSGWLLDLFGTSPAADLEAARAGQRVLVASNNPIINFMLETLASAPRNQDFQSALAELAFLRRGNERLDQHLQALYQTECSACGQKIQVQAFLWRRDEPQPYGKLYECPYCKDEGERPVNPADLEQAAVFSHSGLHRARALERVNLEEGAFLSNIQEALDTYLDRPLYFLFTYLNKIEGQHKMPEKHRKLLQALFISACDEGSALWPYPASRSRPRQLITPPQFRENNLWLALENAIAAWTSLPAPVPLTHWPELPPESGGICLYPGRLKALLPLPDPIQPQAGLAVFPRPIQAFWTLSAIWSGWIWGKEAVYPLKIALERQRYDWNWHTHALQSALNAFQKNSPQGTPLLGFSAELEPGFLLSIISAARNAGFDLKGLALREEQGIGQYLWLPTPEGGPSSAMPTFETASREALTTYLAKRAEPAAYLPLLACAAASFFQVHPPDPEGPMPPDPINRFLKNFNTVLSAPRTFQRFTNGATHNPESGVWWLAEPPNPLEAPLADQVEMEIVRSLQKQEELSLEEIDQNLCARFKGLYTPELELIRVILESYAEISSQFPERWQLRPAEKTTARRADLKEASVLLADLAKQFGLLQQGENPLNWKDSSGRVVYTFHLGASSMVARYLTAPQAQNGQRVIVLPGSRANLLAYKLQKDLRLARLLAPWHVLKFRYLRQLAGRPDLTPELLRSLLDSDPPTWQNATQLSIF